MNNAGTVVTLLAVVVALGGCANAINYHHSERNSVALEAKPNNPTQPIQGNVGSKTQTTLIAPGVSGGFGFAPFEPSCWPIVSNLMDAKKKCQQLDDSTSFVSDFNLQRMKSADNSVVFGTTIVRGSLLTGQAADNASEPALKAFAVGRGYGASDVNDTRNTLLAQMYTELEAKAGADQTAANHFKALNALGERIPEAVASETYFMPSDTDMGAQTLSLNQAGKRTFRDVLDYLGVLDGSLTALNKAKGKRSITKAGKEIDPAELEKELARIVEQRTAFFESVGNSPVIDEAFAFWTASI